MTPIPTQDLRVETSPTIADAQLIVSIQNGPLAVQAMDGSRLLMTAPMPFTYETFTEQYPPTSDEARNVHALLNLMEMVGTFVKQGLLDRGLVYDMYWVAGMWEHCKFLGLALREQSGVPEMYENFESLAAAQT